MEVDALIFWHTEQDLIERREPAVVVAFFPSKRRNTQTRTHLLVEKSGDNEEIDNGSAHFSRKSEFM